MDTGSRDLNRRAPADGLPGQCHARAGVAGHVGHAPCGLGAEDAVLVGRARMPLDPPPEAKVPPCTTWFQAVSPVYEPVCGSTVSVVVLADVGDHRRWGRRIPR